MRYSDMWYDEKRSQIDAEYEDEEIYPEDLPECVDCGEPIFGKVYYNDDDEPVCRECYERQRNEYYYDWMKETGRLRRLSNEKIQTFESIRD